LTDRSPAGGGAAAGRPIPVPAGKLILDKSLCVLFLFLTVPVWLVVIVSIITENLLAPERRGPIFHTEIRVSAGRPFPLYKFRILRPRAEDEIRAGAVPKTVENNPANVTAVGWALKKIGLDELPQLLNILGGKMSFVGPRPKPVAEYAVEIERGRTFRARLRAGLTGPVQVMKGRARTEEDQLNADFAYEELLRRGSQWKIFLFDMRVLAKTILVMVKATGE